MTLKELYSAVLRFTDVTEGRFIEFYNLTIGELIAEYGTAFVLKPDAEDEEPHPAKTIHDKNFAYTEYDGAIIDNIIFLDNESKPLYKEMAISKGRNAYLAVWRKFKPARMRPRKWE